MAGRRHGGLSFRKREKKFQIAKLKNVFLWVIQGAIMVLLAFAFVYLFGIRTSVVGMSMQPTLTNGQEIFIDRFSYLVTRPKQSDVIVFLPKGNMNAHYYVKRIVGTPGDTVLIKDGLLYINGNIYDEAGIFDRIDDGGIAESGVTLAEDEYFVLGDNRNDSEDSRSGNIGVVRREYIIGKAWFHLGSADAHMGLIQ